MSNNSGSNRNTASWLCVSVQQDNFRLFVSWNLFEVLEMKLLSIFQLLSFLKRKMIFGYNRRNFIRRVLILFLPISIVVTFYFKKNTNFSSLILEQSWVCRRFYGNNYWLFICFLVCTYINGFQNIFSSHLCKIWFY